MRGVATSALGKLGLLSDRAKDQAYDRLVELLPDEWLRVRLNAVAALAELKEMKAVGELARTVDRDLDGRVIRAAREAMARLREGADKGEEIRKLREDFDKLSEENRAMKDRLDKLEASPNGAKAARGGVRKRAPAPRRTAKRPKAKVTRVSVNGRRPARKRVAASRSRRCVAAKAGRDARPLISSCHLWRLVGRAESFASLRLTEARSGSDVRQCYANAASGDCGTIPSSTRSRAIVWAQDPQPEKKSHEQRQSLPSSAT